jgi:energy-coupling factor transporter ATP-binding protein EcfA2
MEQPSLLTYSTLGEMITAHKPELFQDAIPKFPIQPMDIKSLQQVLELIEFLKKERMGLRSKKWQRLIDAESCLKKLQSRVGQHRMKKSVVDMIFKVSQYADMPPGKERDELLGNNNFIIYGKPGTGKTTLVKLLAKLMFKLGLLKTDKVQAMSREDLVGTVIGESEKKTKEAIQKAAGGILWIDEAYQLNVGGYSGNCPYGMAVINLICQYGTQVSGTGPAAEMTNFCLSGYKEPMIENVISKNPGMDRRFPHHNRFELDDFTDKELPLIFKEQATERGFALTSDALDDVKFTTKVFKNMGGDTEGLMDCCISVHSRSIYAQLDNNKILTKEIVDRGMKNFLDLKDENGGNKIPESVSRMYL